MYIILGKVPLSFLTMDFDRVWQDNLEREVQVDQRERMALQVQLAHQDKVDHQDLRLPLQPLSVVDF